MKEEYWLDIVMQHEKEKIGDVYCAPIYEDLIHVVDYESYAELVMALNKIAMLGMSGAAYTSDFTEQVNGISRAMCNKHKLKITVRMDYSNGLE